MMGRDHVLVGAALWLGTAEPIAHALNHNLTTPQLAAGTLICAGAALLPDIDHPNSTVAWSLPPLTKPLCHLFAWLGNGHRHRTHTLVFCALAGLAATTALQWKPSYAIMTVICAAWAIRLLGPKMIKHVAYGTGSAIAAIILTALIVLQVPVGAWFVWAVVGGCLAHLAGDMVTKGGVPLLWPLSGKRLGVPILTTNSGVEKVFGWLMIVGVILLAAVDFGHSLSHPAVHHAVGLIR